MELCEQSSRYNQAEQRPPESIQIRSNYRKVYLYERFRRERNEPSHYLSRAGLGFAFFNEPCLRLLRNPFQRISLFLKPENRIDFSAAPHDADRMALADSVLPHHELI